MQIIKIWNYSLPYQNSSIINQNIKKICKEAKIDEKLEDNSFKYEKDYSFIL